MANTYEVLAHLRRPKILIRAAKLGAKQYSAKDDDPTRATGGRHLEDRIKRLAAHEGALEQERREGNACYDMHAHIRVLTALLAEARPFLMRHRAV